MAELVGSDQRSRAELGLSDSGWSRSDTKPSDPGWERRYRHWVIACDVVTTLVVVLAVGAFLAGQFAGRTRGLFTVEVVTVATVIASLSVAHAWDPKFLGHGAEEFAKLGRGLFGSTAALGLGMFALGVPAGARLWVFTAGTALAATLLLQRYLLRKALHRARLEGRCLLPVLAAGDVESVRDIIDRTRDQAHAGWQVEAVCTSGAALSPLSEVGDVPVVGELEEVADHVRRGGYRIVAVTPCSYWTPTTLQRLAWDLEGTGADMVVASGLMEVTGPRLHVSGVFGMPVLRVSEPSFGGFPRVVKGFVDRAGAAVLLAALLPVLLVVSLLVAGTSRGGVFYRQKRVGRDGSEFAMVKYRTMVTGADAMRSGIEASNEGSGPLFKIRDDPRITRVGTVLRRFSIDELPQLWNVLRGHMSLVGPRPPLPDETAGYEPHVRRKLLVKPGITGLWQVSGRSDLPWEEAVRLDLRYVEDWSLALDFVIMWKTARAVLGGKGAY